MLAIPAHKATANLEAILGQPVEEDVSQSDTEEKEKETLLPELDRRNLKF